MTNKKLKIHIPGIFRFEGEGLTFREYRSIIFLFLTFFVLVLIIILAMGGHPTLICTRQYIKEFIHLHKAPAT